MKQTDSNNWPHNLSSELNRTLIKRIPPKKYSPHLEELVNALTSLLAKGEFQLNLDSKNPPEEIKEKGWPETHIEALISSGWLQDHSAPMVLIENKLSWRRWHDDMNEVLNELIKRSKSPTKIQSHSNTVIRKHCLQKLNKEQLEAVEAIKEQSLILLSGGPGTGKTSTVIQMLNQALNICPDLQIGLAAPTGKAARRLQETLHQGVQNIDSMQTNALTSIPCNTIHRWLQARPGGFGKNQHYPLMIDLLVVDEMSMVDLSLMKALLKALPSHCQLILVGDQNQLPPVGSGAIWHHLQENQPNAFFDKSAIHLHQLYRNRGSIADMSTLLRTEGIHTFWKHLTMLQKSENIRIHNFTTTSIPMSIKRKFIEQKEALASLTQVFMEDLEKINQFTGVTSENIPKSSISIMNYLDRLMVLCPRHNGPWGVNEVHKSLLGQKFEKGVLHWPEGTPVMCNENQSELGLANGDIGIVVGKEERRRLLFRVITETGEIEIRFIHPSRIKRIDPAFALTVHKAQGSEAEQVILLWPENNQLSTQTRSQENIESYEARLLYTAITRAKKRVDLVTSFEPK